MSDYNTIFNVQGKTAVITGGGGVLGRVMAESLAKAGANVVVISLHSASARKVSDAIVAEGGKALGLGCDVTNPAALTDALHLVEQTFGAVDILVNGAGGNNPQATIGNERTFFDLDAQAIQDVFRLNFTGTLLSCQTFGRGMAERKQGCIVNVASMASLRPLTRVVTYSAAKAAITNFTQWLAVHMAQEYSANIRVNALAPGFFLTEQNRFLLTEAETGALTARGQAILQHTPMGRFGEPDDLIGPLLWLVSPASRVCDGHCGPG